MTTSALKMHHSVDPKQQLITAVGDLADIRVIANNILVGVYLRPDAMDLGGGKKLYLAETGIRDEDRWQGKVGLVLKKGPLAFVGEEYFGGEMVDVGEWVVFHSADGWSLNINGTLCRMVKDDSLRMVIPTPDTVF